MSDLEQRRVIKLVIHTQVLSVVAVMWKVFLPFGIKAKLFSYTSILKDLLYNINFKAESN